MIIGNKPNFIKLIVDLSKLKNDATLKSRAEFWIELVFVTLLLELPIVSSEVQEHPSWSGKKNDSDLLNEITNP